MKMEQMVIRSFFTIADASAAWRAKVTWQVRARSGEYGRAGGGGLMRERERGGYCPFSRCSDRVTVKKLGVARPRSH